MRIIFFFLKVERFRSSMIYLSGVNVSAGIEETRQTI